jgi:hypothetical protein
LGHSIQVTTQLHTRLGFFIYTPGDLLPILSVGLLLYTPVLCPTLGNNRFDAKATPVT